jgi:hypothetical protein
VKRAPLVAVAILVAACSTPPPRVVAASGYELRVHEVPDASAQAFGQRLRDLDTKLRAVYGIALPRGEVWVAPEAFKEESIGGTYDWFTDRITLAERNEDYLAHELVHRYNRFAFGDLPRWLDEGLAYAISRAGLDALESPSLRRPDFDAIAEVREARARSAQAFPTLESVFEDPYANGHLNVRLATVVVDRMLRDRASEPDMRTVLHETVAAGRGMSPAEAARVLERAAFQDFPRPDELRALLADETASDELILTVAPVLDLDGAAAACAHDSHARRRLALLLDHGRTRQGLEAETRWLEGQLHDPDRRVVRAATYALGARGDARMIGPLIDMLEDAPFFRFVRAHPRGGVSFEAVPIQRTLARLAGDGGAIATDSHDEAEPVPYRTVEAWRRWWAQERRRDR